MADLRQLDATFDFVMSSFLRTGRAPDHAEIAARFGVPPDDGRRLVRELVETKVMPMWLRPGADGFASFAPFNDVPTPYRVTVDGHQKWFAQ